MQKKQIAFILVFLLVVFQNCTGGTKSDPGRNGVDAKGNGDGYAGKVKYIDLDLNNACGGSSKAEIVVTNGVSGVITKENCQSIVPRPVDVSALGLMPHDPAHLIFKENLYQVISDNGQSILFCRSSTTSGSETEKYVFDAIVRQTPNGLIGQVHLGIYDLNMTFKRTVSYEQPIWIQPGPPGLKLWATIDSAEHFVLQLSDGPEMPHGLASINVPDSSRDSGSITVWVPNVSCNLP